MLSCILVAALLITCVGSFTVTFAEGEEPVASFAGKWSILESPGVTLNYSLADDHVRAIVEKGFEHILE